MSLSHFQVVLAVLQWLHANSKDRRKYAAELLLACRLPLVNTQFLNDMVCDDYVISESIEARDVLVDAKQWHLLSERRELLKMFK